MSASRKNMASTSAARPRSRLLARLLAASGILMLLIAATIHVTRPPPSPRRHVAPALEYSMLEPGAPLSPQLGLEIGKEQLAKPFRVATWSRQVYRGPVDARTVDMLVRDKLADTLEAALAPEQRQQLREQLQSLEAEMRDVSLLVEEENQAVMDDLQAKESSPYVMRMPAKPEHHPAYPDLLRVQAAVDRGQGVHWTRPRGTTELVHFLLPWKDFPALRALHDERWTLIRLRTQRIREWIESQYSKLGASIFALDRT